LGLDVPRPSAGEASPFKGAAYPNHLIVHSFFPLLLQAIILFWFTMGYYKGQSDQGNGKVPDLYAEGTTM
jgi:hypothetical protein